ncbi:putative sodium-coupled neutral amino acid transporter 11 isoform X2 [Strongylocentrotus purpuratus]|uniref:Putative sodium-coupled neutral amino acid transporter 11 n=1 Tax=Strongylocentrotus purpuratus TaxID=7668 RepID=A0A7M7P4T9_STRPU|nr:putative sodium-coupled neutral amino acid transporter 11 isoform X2 [Strongylocentrotus purpuratus]
MDSPQNGPTEKTHIVAKSEPIPYEVPTHDKAGLVDAEATADGKPVNIQEEKEGENRDAMSGISGASLNTTNSILGSGIIGCSVVIMGIPYAFMKAGLPLGLILLVVICGITDYSLRLMITIGELTGTRTYAEMTESALGIPGYYVLSIVQFIYPFIAMIGYNIIIGDTITKVFASMIAETNVLANRYFVISIVTVLFNLPVSMYKNVTKLVKAAVLSLVLLLFIMVIVIVRLSTMHVQPTENAWVFGKSTFFESIGIIMFAFICQHNSFLVYDSMEQANSSKWAKVTHISVFGAFIMCAIIGICGYVTFTGHTQGDLLENYCYNDVLVNIARVLFAITIMCTFPLECFVCREVIENVMVRQGWVDSPQPLQRHLILTLIIVGLVLGVSMSTSCLGLVLAVNGVICAVPLICIPSLCYLRVAEGSIYGRDKLPSLLIALMGVIIIISGIVTMIIDHNLTTCTQSEGFAYCYASDIVNASVTPLPASLQRLSPALLTGKS